LVLLLTGCDTNQGSTVSPSLATPYPPPIVVGQSVTGTFVGNDFVYAVTPAVDGTLVVTLNWDPSQGNKDDPAHLALLLGTCAIPQPYTSCPSETSFDGGGPGFGPPAVGKIPVSAGTTYHVVVEEGQSPWDYGFSQPFVLTTTLQ
jgi:hypothetical protein